MPRPSPSGVPGLAIRETDGGHTVVASWSDADGRRRTASFRAPTGELRRAIWDACLKLHEERAAAGASVEEPHVWFATAQGSVQEAVDAEIAAETGAPPDGPADGEADTSGWREERTRTNRERFESVEAKLAREEERLREIERALFRF